MSKFIALAFQVPTVKEMEEIFSAADKDQEKVFVAIQNGDITKEFNREDFIKLIFGE